MASHHPQQQQQYEPVIRRRIVPSRRRRDGLLRYACNYTSQNGEDGIIHRIFTLLPPPPQPHSMCTHDATRTDTDDNNNSSIAVDSTPPPPSHRRHRWCVDVGAWDGQHLSNTYSLLRRHPIPPSANHSHGDNKEPLCVTTETPSANTTTTATFNVPLIQPSKEEEYDRRGRSALSGEQPQPPWCGILIEADDDKFIQLQNLYNSNNNDDVSSSTDTTATTTSIVCLHQTVQVNNNENNNIINSSDDNRGINNNNNSLHKILEQYQQQQQQEQNNNNNDSSSRSTRTNLFPNEFDFLCIDIDGSDYWVLHDLWHFSYFRPIVVCVEFNPTMPNDLIYIPPRNDSIRHGASLAAIVELANVHDYVLVETTLFNAFLLRKQYYEQYLRNEVPDTSIEALWDEYNSTMGTTLYQLYDGTLKLWGCKKLLWHRKPMDESKLQMIPQQERHFPFAPLSKTNTTTSDDDEMNKFDASDVIDISSYCCALARLDGSTLERNEVVEEERQRACAMSLMDQLQQSGFCLVRGTGMDRIICEKALYATNAFLQDADEDVRRSCLATDRARRGYSPMNVENFASLLGEQGPNDLVRKFRVGPITSTATNLDRDADAASCNSLLQPNVWPTSALWEEAEEFRSSVELYYAAACVAAQGIVRAVCDGLLAAHPELHSNLRPLSTTASLSSSSNVNEETDQMSSILTLLGYRVGTRHKGKHKGPLVAAHTDVGIITMLLFDGGASSSCAKLQRSDGNGGWIDVVLPANVPDDPIFVINVADCFSEISQGCLASTVHRVAACRAKTTPRNCCALFVGLDPATVVSIDGEDMTYEDWRKRRIAKAQCTLDSSREPLSR